MRQSFMISALGWKVNSLPPQRKIDNFLAAVDALEAGNLRFQI
jgi:hypothetical protein